MVRLPKVRLALALERGVPRPTLRPGKEQEQTNVGTTKDTKMDFVSFVPFVVSLSATVFLHNVTVSQLIAACGTLQRQAAASLTRFLERKMAASSRRENATSA